MIQMIQFKEELFTLLLMILLDQNANFDDLVVTQIDGGFLQLATRQQPNTAVIAEPGAWLWRPEVLN